MGIGTGGVGAAVGVGIGSGGVGEGTAVGVGSGTGGVGEGTAKRSLRSPSQVRGLGFAAAAFIALQKAIAKGQTDSRPL